MSSCFFFFHVTATTEIYTLSLHDALPISKGKSVHRSGKGPLNKFETKKRDTTDFQNKILKVDVRRGKKRVVKDVEVVIDNPKKIVIPR